MRESRRKKGGERGRIEENVREWNGGSTEMRVRTEVSFPKEPLQG